MLVTGDVPATQPRRAEPPPKNSAHVETRLREAITRLIKRFAARTSPGDTLDEIASLLTEGLPDMKIRFYHVGDGKVKEL